MRVIFYSIGQVQGKGDLMETRLVKQFVLFLLLLFGWTIIALLFGPK